MGCAGTKASLEYGFETDAKKAKKINAYFSRLVALEEFNGVVLVYNNTDKVFESAFNVNPDKTGSSFIDVSSQFDIHSISKLMAKAIIIDMENRNLLKRSDSLGKYLSEFPNGDKITIQHLMDNTSGLPREPNLIGLDKRDLSNDEIIAWAKKETLEFEPGKGKQYSNVGYEVLYYLIGKLHHTTFTSYLENQYFPKLEMISSGGHFYTKKTNLVNWAQNHQYENGLAQVDNINEYVYKQSMLYSTATDLQKFIEHIKQEPYISLLKNNNGIVSWTGGAEGVRSHVQYNVDKDYSFIVLANFDDIPLDSIVETLEKIMEGKSFEMPKAVERTSIFLSEEVLRKYEGTYYFAEANHLVLEFKVEDSHLTIYQDGQLLTALMAENETTFFYDQSSKESIQFQLLHPKSQILFDWKGVTLKGIRK